MRIEPDIKLDYSNVLLRPKRSTLSSRKEVDISIEYKFKHSRRKYEGVPIMASNMDGVGTFSMAKALQEYELLTVLRKHYTIADWKKAVTNGVSLQHLVVSTGTNIIFNKDVSDYLTMQQVLSKFPDVSTICIDVANGYLENFVQFVRRVRKEYPSRTIIAGNVCTPEMTEELIISGADIIKVGIGPGSVCTTRTVTGVGYPQLSAVMECADAAHGLGGHIIADGGCTSPGDVVKAFAGGADFVMLGGMLAGHNEGEVQQVDNEVSFHGMSSDKAMEIHGSRKDGYRGAEGKEAKIPYRGPVSNTIPDILGGLRSACTYVGAIRLKDLSKCATFIRCIDTHNRIFENAVN